MKILVKKDSNILQKKIKKIIENKIIEGFIGWLMKITSSKSKKKMLL